MKEEIGKWLMDIAKYILTAILLTSLFDGLEDLWITYIIAFITTAVTFMTGIVLLRKKTKGGETMGTIITCSFISLIAIASLIYFTIDDRKKSRGRKKGSLEN